MQTSTTAPTVPEKRATEPQNTPDPAVVAAVSDPAYQLILGAVARGWCYGVNAGKTMDPDLAVCIAYEVYQCTKSLRGDPCTHGKAQHANG